MAANIDTTAVTSALGVGSGMDIKVIAQSLADAKVLPQKQRVEADIEQYNARVSGYSALNYYLSQSQGH